MQIVYLNWYVLNALKIACSLRPVLLISLYQVIVLYNDESHLRLSVIFSGHSI